MSMNLLLAPAAEHKQRTGHDIWTANRFSTLHLTCDVCLFLNAEKRVMDEDREEHFAAVLESHNQGKRVEG